ncbi:type IV secretory system conjugative DNA transfer family protein [Asticcacaulis sp. EMRT-3]|uniref:type IV secretory system conjugative DNA transfer family protein n=1 Tax=Asticcacaulis sp. EMRT-3 TaxID=3040349 RepID=UPI0024AF2F2C|nr:type IV secretory system conjugative DNA transfer family protein [Asticcacaulis sp. EMRT-3]MDI7776568.1 type IV secretory system conjugative DNA transfer family protein [Asticcacaulis sp. EMRT-3]
MKKALLITALLIIYAVAGFSAVKFLAGNLFFIVSKAMPSHVTLHTWDSYWHFYSHLPAEKKRLKIALAMAIVVVFGIPALVMTKVLGSKPRSLHGDARFATGAEIRKAGLFGDEGIIVGQRKGRYLIFAGQQFVLLAAPTRSGKGVSVVIPNLLNFSGSVVVLDIKLENFRLTSKFREHHGQAVFLFSPFAEDFKTHRWNPLDGVSRDPNYCVGDIQALAQAFYPSIEGKDNFWNDQARNLFLGVVLYLIETPKLPCTLGEVLRQSSGKGQPLKDYLQSLTKKRMNGNEALSEACLDALGRFCATSENTLTSILATFNAPLTIFANPIVDAATSGSDFDISRVRKDLMSIYIGIQPNRLADASLLINVFFSQLLNLNMRELPQNNLSLKHQCLLILDEFTAMGRVGIVAKANAFLAGYNLRLLTIVQSVGQLESVYGDRDTRTLLTNHALQIIFSPREQRDANAYSEMLGTYTEKSVSRGTSHPRGGGHGSNSENTSDQRRPLMLPQELKEMGQDKEVILLEGTKPILCRKARYYDDPTFINRLKVVSSSLSLLKAKLPNRQQLDAAAFIQPELSAPVPDLDIGLHKAKAEGRKRALKPGEVIDVSRLDIDLSAVPKITNQEFPTKAEALAVVDNVLEQFDSLSPDLGDLGSGPSAATSVHTAMDSFDALAPAKKAPVVKKPRARKSTPGKPAKTKTEPLLAAK